MRKPGRILLVACYELGHQPLAVAWPAAFLERAGFTPALLDLSVEPLDPEKITRARFVAISVPMHTALRLGVIATRRIRALNPDAHICLYGHYAALNQDELLSDASVDTVLAGEMEDALVALPRLRRRRLARRARQARLPRASTPRAPVAQDVRPRRA